MKLVGIKRTGVGIVAACACMFAALNASAAWAGKTLELKAEGTTVAAGSPGFTGLAIDGCLLFSQGEVTVNGASKDKLTGTAISFNECQKTKTISGMITETQLFANGKVSLIGTVTLTEETGPCVYTFKKFKTKFETRTTFKGSAKGKLSKEASASTCAKSVIYPFEADATNESLGEPYEAFVNVS